MPVPAEVLLRLVAITSRLRNGVQNTPGTFPDKTFSPGGETPGCFHDVPPGQTIGHALELKQCSGLLEHPNMSKLQSRLETLRYVAQETFVRLPLQRTSGVNFCFEFGARVGYTAGL
jgi:hypothetical protein